VNHNSSESRLKILFLAIENLVNLELLNFDRNFITEIPVSLTNCSKLFQLSLEECARLFSIPKNLLTMPNLVNVSFRGCNLITIPSMISSKIENLLFSGNQLLNCVPHEAVKYLDENISTSEFYMVDENDLETMINAQ
jgi:Leucine-rich repeat (LRR) protein